MILCLLFLESVLDYKKRQRSGFRAVADGGSSGVHQLSQSPDGLSVIVRNVMFHGWIFIERVTNSPD